MNWSDDSRKLKRNVNARIPFFVRGFVDRTITRTAETIAAERRAAEVEVADVVRAYLANTPKAMQGLLTKAMKEQGIEPAAYGFEENGEEHSFPIGEPMTREEIDAFLDHAVTGRLGTFGGGKPYVVPLSFVYLDGMIYYHWFSHDGRKVRNIRENAAVCFEADEYSRDHLSYMSVIADGVIARVADRVEKGAVMRALAEKFPEYATGAGHNDEILGIVEKGFDALVDAVEIYRIDIDSIAGKKKGKI